MARLSDQAPPMSAFGQDSVRLFVENLDLGPDRVGVVVRSGAMAAPCPACGTVSLRVQSRYLRRAADLLLGGRCVELLVVVRRFRCDAVLCGRRIFAERFTANVLAPWARRRHGWSRSSIISGSRFGGRPAASLAERLMLPVSNDTLCVSSGGGRHRRSTRRP